MKKKVALKYCGGCDPNFDRVEYFKKICVIAHDSIHWVHVDDQESDAILIICGCDIACAEASVDLTPYFRIISLRDEKWDPRDIVEALLK